MGLKPHEKSGLAEHCNSEEHTAVLEEVQGKPLFVVFKVDCHTYVCVCFTITP